VRVSTILGVLILSAEFVCSQEVGDAVFTRTFKINATSLLWEDFSAWSSFTSSPETFDWQEEARNALKRGGFDLTEHNQAKVFYNDRTEILHVSGTLREIDLIENILNALNSSPPPLVSLEVRIAFGEAGKLDKLLEPFRAARSVEESRLYIPISLDEPKKPYTLGLTRDDTKVVLRELEQKESIDLVTLPRVETVGGRTARVSFRESYEPIFIPPLHAPQGNSKSGFYFNAE
jgi:hypothetical protein